MVKKCWINALLALAFVQFSTAALFAQEPASNPPNTPIAPEAPSQPPGGNRVFDVLPNYRTINESDVKGPLTNRQKLTIASKDSFDYPLVLLAGALAGIGQWADQDPSYGQGMAGFGKRLASGYADQALGNMMTEGFFSVLLHEDPRYYRRGTGTTLSRTNYAFTRIFVTHADSGVTRFNYAEWGGNAAATAISNSYNRDGRTAQDNALKLIEQCAIDGIGQVLKEFWPDIKEKFFKGHKSSEPGH
jgi:hypothetical protein